MLLCQGTILIQCQIPLNGKSIYYHRDTWFLVTDTVTVYNLRCKHYHCWLDIRHLPPLSKVDINLNFSDGVNIRSCVTSHQSYHLSPRILSLPAMSRSYLKLSFTSSNQIVKFKQKLFTAVLKSNFLCIRLVLLCQKSISLDRNIQFSTPPGYWTRDSDAMRHQSGWRAGELTSICVQQTLDNVTSRWPIFLIVWCRNNETGDGASDMRHQTVTLASALHIPLALCFLSCSSRIWSNSVWSSRARCHALVVTRHRESSRFLDLIRFNWKYFLCLTAGITFVWAGIS